MEVSRITTHYDAQLGLTDKGCAVKWLVVYTDVRLPNNSEVIVFDRGRGTGHWAVNFTCTQRFINTFFSVVGLE